MKKKFSDKLEKFLVLNTAFLIYVFSMFYLIVPHLGIFGYYLIFCIGLRRIIHGCNLIVYYWDHLEACPGVYWCEKLTEKLIKKGYI